MPLIDTFYDNNSKIGIWEIDNNDKLSKYNQWLSASYHPDVLNYKNKTRIQQVFAARMLSNELYPGYELCQNKQKKPFLKPPDFYISLSNDNNYVAMIGSNIRCGIDIQSEKSNIKKIQHKFVNTYDCINNGNLNELMWLWCAKETLYKVFGVPEILFKEHLIVFYNDENQLYGKCIHSDYSFKCRLYNKKYKNNFLVYTGKLDSL